MTNIIDTIWHEIEYLQPQDHKGQVIAEYASLTTKALNAHGELLTTAMDNHIENRELLLRLIQTLVNNGVLNKKDDVEFILNKKLERG